MLNLQIGVQSTLELWSVSNVQVKSLRSCLFVLKLFPLKGAHRQLGPSVTRVRSAKLDSWEIEDINIISATGNKIANHYWENKMPKHFKRLEVGLPMDEVKNYIFEKYVKKSFVSPTVKHPVREYLAAVKARDITPGEFYKTYLKK